MKKKILMLLSIVACCTPALANANKHNTLSNPVPGVVCDTYFCVDASGISDPLTTRYLGEKKGKELIAQGAFDRSTFTFANGVYCDTKEKVCRKDRYFGADGKPSGAIDDTTTRWLFGH